jgi:hypothetical protein
LTVWTADSDALLSSQYATFRMLDAESGVFVNQKIDGRKRLKPVFMRFFSVSGLKTRRGLRAISVR